MRPQDFLPPSSSSSFQPGQQQSLVFSPPPFFLTVEALGENEDRRFPLQSVLLFPSSPPETRAFSEDFHFLPLLLLLPFLALLHRGHGGLCIGIEVVVVVVGEDSDLKQLY